MLPTTPKEAGRASIEPYTLAANVAFPSATIQAVGSVICYFLNTFVYRNIIFLTLDVLILLLSFN
jgi:hypothetical protein